MTEKLITKKPLSKKTRIKIDAEVFLDSFEQGTFKGWAWDKNQPDKRLQLELLDGDTIISITEASLFRKDLLEANIGDGHYGYIISVPQHILDGEIHKLTLRDQISGHILPGSPFEFVTKRSIKGYVDGIYGSVVSGWAEDLLDPNRRIVVDLYENDELISSATTDVERADRLPGFRLPLPHQFLDGKIHFFVVKDNATGKIIGTLGTITPYIVYKV